MAATSTKTTEVACGVVAPVVGMSMFWPFFRYASYILVLFPPDRTIPSPFGAEAAVVAHYAFLVALTVLMVLALVLRDRVCALIDLHRRTTALLIALGSVASGMSLGAAESSMSPIWLWPAVVLAALSFITGYLAWACHFSVRFGKAELLVLAVSMAISYLLFSREGLLGSLFDGWLAALLIPLGTALCWLASTPYSLGDRTLSQANEGRDDGAIGTRVFSISRPFHPSVLVMATFLLVGGAVRGIVDVQATMSGARFGLSVVLCTLVVAACLAFGRRPDESPRATTLFIVATWLALSAVFLAGLFVFLVLDNQGLGGDIVVVSRTVMEFAFWALLCHIAATQRIPTVPLFLLFGVSVELASWILSYAVVPILFGPAGASEASVPFVLVVIFSLTAVIVVGVTGYLVLALRSASGHDAMSTGGPAELETDGFAIGGSSPEASEGIPDGAVLDPRADPDDSLIDYLVRHDRLTPREAQVSLLYARGRSLSKVAEQMSISKSTAQTHIKAAYRKLNVHNRDELIEYLGM